MTQGEVSFELALEGQEGVFGPKKRGTIFQAKRIARTKA